VVRYSDGHDAAIRTTLVPLALLLPSVAQAQTFTEQAIASIGFPNSVHAADLNGDGDLDLLTHYRNGTNSGFHWYVFVAPEQDEAVDGYSPTLTATESTDEEGDPLS
jgi:hypothetical protein